MEDFDQGVLNLEIALLYCCGEAELILVFFVPLLPRIAGMWQMTVCFEHEPLIFTLRIQLCLLLSRNASYFAATENNQLNFLQFTVLNVLKACSTTSSKQPRCDNSYLPSALKFR